MKKRLENMVDVYLKRAKVYDYIHRVLASFAEIYHYDFSESALMEDGSYYHEKESVLRRDCLVGRIRAFYEEDFQKELPVKLFAHEVVMNERAEKEYGYFVFGKDNLSYMAELISLGVRILEAFGLRHLSVYLDASDFVKEELYRDLDALDIDYEEKKLHISKVEEIAFQIVDGESDQKKVLIEGGDVSSYGRTLSSASFFGYGFWGFTEDIVLKLREEMLPQEELDVVVTYGSTMEEERALYLTQELRLNGFKCEMISRDTKEKIMKNYPTHYVLSVLEEDMKTSLVLLTDLLTNEKEKINEMDLIGHLDVHL